MDDTPSERRVVMARNVAARWLAAHAQPLHSLTVYYGAREIKNLPGLLRSFRDERIRLGSMAPIPDLGLREEFDHFVVWSSDREGLVALSQWLEVRGCETSGIW
jgi:hypothetical protein